MGFVPITQDYPWDQLTPYAATAREHPGGLVDLSIGTPVDPTPPLLQRALVDAADSPGYPTVQGTAAVREAMVSWWRRRRGVVGLDVDGVLATVGSKELVALLPALLSIGQGDVVIVPETAYPTYEVGATTAGATVIATDDVSVWAGRDDVALVWLNSPANPTGAVASVEQLREVVTAARGAGAVVASDECYSELPWQQPWLADGVPSVLHPQVAGAHHDGLLALYSLSKQSNFAGYRAGLVAGDVTLMTRLTLMRRHLGLIVPGPVQAAMAVALADDEHVTAQREVYRARRDTLLPALLAAGYEVDHSEAGLYLWARAADGADCWTVLGRLAEVGILAGPGAFYGASSGDHVRLALTATDERIDAAAARLRS